MAVSGGQLERGQCVGTNLRLYRGVPQIRRSLASGRSTSPDGRSSDVINSGARAPMISARLGLHFIAII